MTETHNRKLKEPPLQIDLEKDNVVNTNFKNKSTLEKLLSDCLLKIEEMHQEVIKNTHLEKYFLKAGTDKN